MYLGYWGYTPNSLSFQHTDLYMALRLKWRVCTGYPAIEAVQFAELILTPLLHLQHLHLSTSHLAQYKLKSLTFESGIVFFSCLPLHVRVLNYEIIGVGIIGMIAGTFAAIYTLVEDSDLVPPCYINQTAADSAVNCC